MAQRHPICSVDPLARCPEGVPRRNSHFAPRLSPLLTAKTSRTSLTPSPLKIAKRYTEQNPNHPVSSTSRTLRLHGLNSTVQSETVLTPPPPFFARRYSHGSLVVGAGGEGSERRTVVARECEDRRIKISWTNVPADTRAEELAYMQAQHHWIERSFEEAKSELGMAEYEVRKRRGWRHHMALVSLAALFLLKERTARGESAALLSARDVVELLRFYLPRRSGTEKEVLDDLVRRHQLRREASINHAKRRRRRRIAVTK